MKSSPGVPHATCGTQRGLSASPSPPRTSGSGWASSRRPSSRCGASAGSSLPTWCAFLAKRPGERRGTGAASTARPGRRRHGAGAGDGVKPRSRESELKAAIVRANLPPRDLKVYLVLMERAEWNTARITVKFQPRSLEELARWCHMSVANVKRSLNHLQRHGWVERYRHLTDKGIGGRRHPTHYQLEHGRDCDCRTQKGAQPEPVSGEKGAQKCTIKGLKSEDIAAGQAPVSAKSVRERGGGRESRALRDLLPALGPLPSVARRDQPPRLRSGIPATAACQVPVARGLLRCRGKQVIARAGRVSKSPGMRIGAL